MESSFLFRKAVFITLPKSLANYETVHTALKENVLSSVLECNVTLESLTMEKKVKPLLPLQCFSKTMEIQTEYCDNASRFYKKVCTLLCISALSSNKHCAPNNGIARKYWVWGWFTVRKKAYLSKRFLESRARTLLYLLHLKEARSICDVDV